jgi:hypothetical protein
MGPKGSSTRGGGLPRQQDEGGSDQLPHMDQLMELMAS